MEEYENSKVETDYFSHELCTRPGHDSYYLQFTREEMKLRELNNLPEVTQ